MGRWAKQHGQYTWFLPQTSQDANQKSQLPLSLWIIRYLSSICLEARVHRTQGICISVWCIYMLKKRIQFLVIRLLNYKNEVQLFTSDNSNGAVCQRLRVKFYSSCVTIYIKRTIYLRWQQITIFEPPPHTHYTLSVAIEVVQFFVPLCSLRQLCAPFASQCGLAERLYHYIESVKIILVSFTYCAPPLAFFTTVPANLANFLIPSP